MTTTRRSLLSGAGALLGASALAAGCAPAPLPDCPPAGEAWNPPDPATAWQPGGWFHHDSVDAARVAEGLVRARLLGSWRELALTALPQRFVDWSFSERLLKLDDIAARGFDTRALEGPHNACVASFGGPALGSFTSLNTAYKGIGWMPLAAQLAEAVGELQARSAVLARAGLDMQTRLLRALDVLRALYREPDLFDRTRQVSLELFAAPGFATHTFANLLANPVVSLSFLAFPAFEIRAVAQLLHPLDPGLTEAERLAIAWIDGVHDLAHGGDGNQRIACIYHVIELYDDTPSGEGRGRRLAP
ncbi:MAG: hypothetical protein ABIO70_35705 [Pseudomonadota bacterium]